jgi:glutathione S-transferase
MTLHEKQAKFDMVVVDFATGQHKQPEHLARQPFGQIPALSDGDFQMFESRAMMRYIDETVPGQALTPKDPQTRGHMEQWISVESEQFNPGAGPLVYQELFLKMQGKPADAAKVEEAKKKLAFVLPVLDKHLAKGPHFCGDQFTLADIAYMPYTEYALNTSAKDMILSHKNFAAWWARVSDRAAWKKSIAS